ncbi:hypothetical protein [Halopseudomonas pelagia]|uniref:Uncharacterized protein n=1 Tax=Halopseudomonas pelagia TaxID=553151 RepID=A0AA91U102_9GAMM|nr:hypothetical protein [Halopseudomonas pelagia]PCC98660.1 hypothetical protein CO192_14100 [Halopseudomonas pelagia]QFY56710.1 hypothetical protein EAO82_10200 [Halopseudomonas pelagia]
MEGVFFLVVMLILFGSFIAIRVSQVGFRAAFGGEFNPNGQDKKTKEMRDICSRFVAKEMKETYQSQPDKLSIALPELVDGMSTFVGAMGYKVKPDTIESMVRAELVSGGHVSQEQADGVRI